MPRSHGRKPVPAFSSEDEERAFWAAHDSTEYVDWKSGRRRAFPNLRRGKGGGRRDVGRSSTTTSR
ncbi:hypothetical protein FBQ97_21265 [Acidobacteria bacterium ACD]|nr:MAG: hypothetical protein EDX89_13195 [Acidobacteriota bacterium]MDL1952318.1 hypothetical protein [Acidobacteria bacterium ACD]